MTQHHLTASALCAHFFQAFILCTALLGFSQNLNSQTIYALSGSKLVSFSATAPGTILSSVGISGTAAGQDIAGLDFRPNTGELYALGYIKPLEKPNCTPSTLALARLLVSARPPRSVPIWAR